MLAGTGGNLEHLAAIGEDFIQYLPDSGLVVLAGWGKGQFVHEVH
jgi:hypothetical protein